MADESDDSDALVSRAEQLERPMSRDAASDLLGEIARIVCEKPWPQASRNDRTNALITAAAVMKAVERASIHRPHAEESAKLLTRHAWPR